MEILCKKHIYYLGLACPFLRSDKTRFRSKFIVTNQSSRVEFLSIILWTKRYHLSKSVLVSLAEEHWNRSEAIECNRSQENKFLWSCEPTTFTSKKSRVHFGKKGFRLVFFLFTVGSYLLSSTSKDRIFFMQMQKIRTFPLCLRRVLWVVQHNNTKAKYNNLKVKSTALNLPYIFHSIICA